MEKKGWMVLVVLIVAIAVIAIFAKKPADKEIALKGDTVKIGFIGPLSGEAASYGESMRQGVELAVEQINSKGGIGGKKIEMIYEDGKCAGKDAASAAQKLVSVDQVKFIVGAGCSGETIAAAPIVEPAKVLTLSPVSSNATISTMGDYIFRNHPSDNDAGTMLANLIIKKTNKVAVISENTDYAQGIRKVFKNAFTAAGGTLAVDEAYNTGVGDFRSLVSKIKASGATAVFIDAQTETSLIQLATQLKEQKVSAQLYTAYMTGDAVKQKATLLNGLIAVDLPNPPASGNGGNLLNLYKATFNREPNFPYFVASSYDAVHLLADGIKSVGYDSTKVKDYLYGIKNYDGAAGSYHFDSNGDVVGIALTIKQLKDGQFVIVQ
jgi:branched-chain amino acid transport system substrate-binding protein